MNYEEVRDFLGILNSGNLHRDKLALERLDTITSFLGLSEFHERIVSHLQSDKCRVVSNGLYKYPTPDIKEKSLIEYLRKMKSNSDKGDVNSNYRYGMILYIFGDEGKSKGFQYFLSAAENDHAESQYMLYHYYETGWYVEKDLSKSDYWLEKAVSTGHKTAKETLNQRDSFRELERDFKSRNNRL